MQTQADVVCQARDQVAAARHRRPAAHQAAAALQPLPLRLQYAAGSILSKHQADHTPSEQVATAGGGLAASRSASSRGSQRTTAS